MNVWACQRGLGRGLGQGGLVAAVALTLTLTLGCSDQEGLNGPGATPTGTAGVAGAGSPSGSWETTGAGGVAGTGSPSFDGGVIGVGGIAGAASSVTGGGNSCGALAGAMSRGSRPLNQPVIGTPITAAVAPPAISGGTMRVLADGVTVVAADPDRDQVYVVDLTTRSLRATVTLQPGDEPGRVITDGAGRAHVALRRGGAIVTIDPASGTLLARRAVCAAPRGLAYDPGVDLIHVACAGGELVSLGANGGAAVRTIQLDRDLRDVVVDGSRLRVSRFKSAEILSVESDGSVSGRIVPPMFTHPSVRTGQQFTAGVAYQMLGAPDGSVVMLHQRGVADTIKASPGAYGDISPCSSVVHPAVTVVTPSGEVKTGPALAGMVLAVDAAISANGSRIAFVAAGNAHNTSTGLPAPARVFVSEVTAVSDRTINCPTPGVGTPSSCAMTSPPPNLGTPDGGAVDAGRIPDGGAADAGSFSGLGPCSATDVPTPTVVGEAIAVAFAGDGMLVVQSREPANLALGDGSSIPLATQSRADTGHLIFHANTGKGVACASCHAEGNDDGRVWNFDCGGGNAARRTQSMHTGLRGTEPFHWSGDEADFSRLMNDVFVSRMSGPVLPTDQMDMLLTWIDTQPRPVTSAPRDLTAVQRGKALFEDTKSAACVTCHAGARFSTNVTADVGTGAPFQVPSLLGIGSRGPFMHNGCAATLRDRFSPACGGGDKHGVTSSLSEVQISDLVAYLESL